MIAILADHRVDHDLVTGQALLDDSWGSGAETTPCSSHNLQARFSRLLINTKYFAGSTSSWELSSWPITVVCFPQPRHTHCSGVQVNILSTRGRFAGSSCRPGCWHFRLRGGLHRWALALRLDLHTADSRLQFQQLQLC